MPTGVMGKLRLSPKGAYWKWTYRSAGELCHPAALLANFGEAAPEMSILLSADGGFILEASPFGGGVPPPRGRRRRPSSLWRRVHSSKNFAILAPWRESKAADSRVGSRPEAAGGREVLIWVASLTWCVASSSSMKLYEASRSGVFTAIKNLLHRSPLKAKDRIGFRTD